MCKHFTSTTEKEKKAIKSIVADPNYFYNYAKKYSRESKQIGQLLKDGIAISADKEMANILIEQYSSVLRMPREEVTDEFVDNLMDVGENEKVMDTIVVNHAVVKEALSDISNVSASGPDGVSAVLIKIRGDRIINEMIYILL